MPGYEVLRLAQIVMPTLATQTTRTRAVPAMLSTQSAAIAAGAVVGDQQIAAEDADIGDFWVKIT